DAACMSARIFVGSRLDGKWRVIDHFDWRESWKAPADGPNPVTSDDRNGQNQHAGFDGHARGAGFEFFRAAISVAASALGKNYHDATFAQPLYRTSNWFRIATFQLQRPRAKHAQPPTHDGPTEGGVPCQVSHGPFDGTRNPERVDVR